MSPARLKLGRTTLGSIAYALPAIAAAFLFAPAGGLIQSLYGTYFGISLQAVAIVMLVSRVVDAVGDPLVGVFSDSLSNRFGGRRVTVLLGGFAFLIVTGLLWVPLIERSPIYFMVISVLYFVGWSLFDIPHSAWAAEISDDSAQRRRLYAWRTTALYVGNAIFSLVLMYPAQAQSIIPATMRLSLILGVLLMVAALVTMMRFAPRGQPPKARVAQTLSTYSNAVLGNRPLLILILTYFVAGFGYGSWSAMLFIFTDSYLGAGPMIGQVLFAGMAAALVSIPIWVRISSKFGQISTWAISILMSAILMIATIFVSPGSAMSGFWLLAISVGMFFCFAAQNAITPSIMADVVDFGTLKYGQERAGAYFALLTMITKANAGFGAAFGYYVAGLYGFVPGAHQHDARAVLGMRLAFEYIPAACALTACILAFKNPLNDRRRTIVHRRLVGRDRRESILNGPSNPT